jgi:Domain of unknown function (DUF4189)
MKDRILALYLVIFSTVAMAEGGCPPGTYPANPPATNVCYPLPASESNQSQAQPQAPQSQWIDNTTLDAELKLIKQLSEEEQRRLRNQTELDQSSKPVLIWGAAAFSNTGEMGLGVGMSEASAKEEALKNCDKDTCNIISSWQGDICIAYGHGKVKGKKKAKGSFAVFNTHKDKATVEAMSMKECQEAGAIRCKIDFLECLDGTP